MVIKTLFLALTVFQTAWSWAEHPSSFDPESAVSEFKNQAQQVQEAQKEKTLSVETKLVLVDVTVKDKGGRTIPNLKKGDFKIFEDGFPQTVSDITVDKLPLAVALVLDASSSIWQYQKILRHAARKTLETLKPEDQVAVFVTGPGDSNLVPRAVDLTPDRAMVYASIDNLKFTGTENLDGGLYAAARYLGERTSGMRPVIILISDDVQSNMDENSMEGFSGPVLRKKADGEIMQSNATIYNIKVPGHNDPVWLRWVEQIWLPWFQKIVDLTGGKIFSTMDQSPMDVEQALESIVEDLKTRYTLSYYPTDHPAPSIADPKAETIKKKETWGEYKEEFSKNKDQANGSLNSGVFHSVNVELIPGWGAKGTDYKLVARKGYYANKTVEVPKP